MLLLELSLPDPPANPLTARCPSTEAAADASLALGAFCMKAPSFMLPLTDVAASCCLLFRPAPARLPPCGLVVFCFFFARLLGEDGRAAPSGTAAEASASLMVKRTY